MRFGREQQPLKEHFKRRPIARSRIIVNAQSQPFKKEIRENIRRRRAEKKQKETKKKQTKFPASCQPLVSSRTSKAFWFLTWCFLAYEEVYRTNIITGHHQHCLYYYARRPD